MSCALSYVRGKTPVPTDPELPQQFQPFYWYVVAPVIATVTTLFYLFGKRLKGGERGEDKEHDRLKEEVAALLRKDERNQTNRDIYEHCDKLRDELRRSIADNRKDIDDNLQQVVKATRVALEDQIKAVNLQLIDIGRQIRRMSRQQPKGRQP